MTTVLVLVAMSLAVAPRPALVRHRLRSLLPAPSPARRPRRLPVGTVGHPAAAAAVGAGAFGAAAGVLAPGASLVLPLMAGAAAGGTAGRMFGAALTRRRRDRTAAAQVEAIAAVAAEVRAGQRPDAALAAAGLDDVPPAITAIWTLSERSGAPVATVLDRVEDDLRSRVRQRQAVGAQLAGARSTALLLAGLPAVGIGMGAAMGAAPLSTLFGSRVGQLALLVGIVLDCSGVLWSARIVVAADGDR